MDENFLVTADALIQAQTEAGIAACRQRDPKPVNFDGDCICGSTIPEGRIALGYYRCLDCQTRKEKGWRSPF